MKITGLAVLMSVALLCVAAPVVPEQVKTAPVKTPPASPVKRNRTPRKAAKPAAKRRQAPQKVMISKFNPDAKDATPALKKALRSGARRIIFDRPGTYFLRPVTVRSHLTIIRTSQRGIQLGTNRLHTFQIQLIGKILHHEIGSNRRSRMSRQQTIQTITFRTSNLGIAKIPWRRAW